MKFQLHPLDMQGSIEIIRYRHPDRGREMDNT